MNRAAQNKRCSSTTFWRQFQKNRSLNQEQRSRRILDVFLHKVSQTKSSLIRDIVTYLLVFIHSINIRRVRFLSGLILKSTSQTSLTPAISQTVKPVSQWIGLVLIGRAAASGTTNNILNTLLFFAEENKMHTRTWSWATSASLTHPVHFINDQAHKLQERKKKTWLVACYDQEALDNVTLFMTQP